MSIAAKWRAQMRPCHRHDERVSANQQPICVADEAFLWLMSVVV